MKKIRSSLLVFVASIALQSFAAAETSKSSCAWTSAQSERLVQAYVEYVYKKVQPLLLAKGVMAYPDAVVSSSLDTRIDSDESRYQAIDVHYVSDDGLEMMILTESTSHNLPFQVIEQREAGGRLVACLIQSKDVLVTDVLNSETEEIVTHLNQKLLPETFFRYPSK